MRKNSPRLIGQAACGLIRSSQRFVTMNTSRIKLLSSLFLILGALTLIARADVLAKYSFPVTNDASANPVVANMTATSAARTGTLGIWEVGSSLYTYASSPVLRVAPGTGATSASTAVANNSYFSFTLTPNSAYVLICTNLSFNIARGGGTYPNRGYVVRSSLDSYAADLSASPVTTVRPTWTNIFINLGSSFSNLQSTLTFRIYIFAEGTGGSLELDDITVSGSAVLVAPSGLTVGITNYQAWLTWASAPGSTNYVVLRSTTSGGPYTRIATNAATSFTESGLAHGTTYYYVVLGQSNLGETPNSNQGSGTTAPDAPVATGAAMSAALGASRAGRAA